MFRNFVSNGHTYRVSTIVNNIVFAFFFDLDRGQLTDANRDRFLSAIAAKLGTDTRTAYRVARAMDNRHFVHWPLNPSNNGPVNRRAMDRMGYVAA